MCAALVSKSRTFNALCATLKEEFEFPKMKLSPKQEEIHRNTSIFIETFMRTTATVILWGISVTCMRRPIFDRQTEFTIVYDGWLPFEVNTWFR